MAEQRKPRSGGNPSARKSADGKPERTPRGGSPRRAGAPRKGSESSDRKPYEKRDGGQRASTPKPGAKKPYDRKPGAERERPPREREERTEEQKAYDGPEVPAFITGQEIDRSVAAQLKSLPDKLIVRVSRQLAAAQHFLDSDPELAYQYAKAAKARTQRLAVIREALGETAYAAGHYAEALSELRAAKRMNGATAYLPIMADCHRALGQPEQAIKLAQSPGVRNFVPEAKAEMTIVEAGARRDMGQFDAALRTLEMAPLNHKGRGSWVVRLRYAYADTLAAAGRLPEALEWFHRTYAVDGEEITDAATRAEELEKLVSRD